MKTYGVTGCIDHVLLTLALVGGAVSFTLCLLYHRGEPAVPIGYETLGSRTVLDDAEKRKFLALPGLELQPYSIARSQSSYRTK
jgi:hypothetical protein